MGFVTSGNSSPSYTTGIIKEGSKYSVFDTHSRNAEGMCSPDGTAVVTFHYGLNDLVTFYSKLARSLSLNNECPFELVPIVTT